MHNILLLGYGEIGKAVFEVFSGQNNITVYDPALQKDPPEGTFDVLFVCFPYGEHFVEQAFSYIEKHSPKCSVVFSTVAIGTTAQLPNAVHSPVEGRHPDLASSIRLFPRWIGGSGPAAIVAQEIFEGSGLRIRPAGKPEFTEFLKLRSTSKYGVNIVWAGYEKNVTDSLDMDFEMVKEFDRDYNSLYDSLGCPNIRRYILSPPTGPIGGHCVVPNADILRKQYPSTLLDCICEFGKEEAKAAS